LIDEHFDSFQQTYDEPFQGKYGFWRPGIERSVAAFLKCGDLQEGFARVRCSDCKHEMFVAYSCKQPTIAPLWCPAQRISFHSIFWLVFQQIKRHAKKGRSSGRAIEPR